MAVPERNAEDDFSKLLGMYEAASATNRALVDGLLQAVSAMGLSMCYTAKCGLRDLELVDELEKGTDLP